MADLAIYASVESSTARARAQWIAALAQVTAHPIIQQINGAGGIHPANQVSLTAKCEGDASVSKAILSFVMLSAQRGGMRAYALGVMNADAQAFGAWCAANRMDPMSEIGQYSYVFTQIATGAGVTGVMCRVVGLSEDRHTAAAAMRQYVEANAADFYGE